MEKRKWPMIQSSGINILTHQVDVASLVCSTTVLLESSPVDHNVKVS